MVGVERETGGLFAARCAVGPAAPELGPGPGSEERESGPGLEGEAALLGQVRPDRNGPARKPLGQTAELGQGLLRRLWQVKLGKGGKDRLRLACSTGESGEDRPARSTGRLLVSERKGALQARPCLRFHPDLVGKKRGQARPSQIHRKRGHPRLGKCLHGKAQDLRHPRTFPRPEELHPDLQALADGIHRIGLGPQTLPGIGEAQRTREMAQAGGGDAGDLGRDVRAQCQHPPACRIQETEGRDLAPRRTFPRALALARTGDGGGELAERRLDRPVAPATEARKEPGGKGQLALGLFREGIREAGRQKGGGHGTLQAAAARRRGAAAPQGHYSSRQASLG